MLDSQIASAFSEILFSVAGDTHFPNPNDSRSIISTFSLLARCSHGGLFLKCWQHITRARSALELRELFSLSCRKESLLEKQKKGSGSVCTV